MATLEGPPKYKTSYPDRVVQRLQRMMIDLRDLYGADGCWHWPMSRTTSGYGQIAMGIAGTRGSMTFRAHRVAWFAAGHPLPEGMTIDHLCRTPACINPSHMRLLSLGENSANSRAALARSAKTHCKWGHEFTPENTRWYGKNQRGCKACGAGRPAEGRES